MRTITNLSNTDAPSSDYPYGRVRDKTISIQGTPVDEKLTGDMTQFFNKLMDYAGVTPNELPDNEYSGFQLMEALMALMGNVKTKIIEIGAWDMDASATPSSIVHGIASINDIRSIDAIIINDNNTGIYQFAPGAVSIFATATDIILNRENAGFFDSTDFNDASMNRGYVIIRYTESL